MKNKKPCDIFTIRFFFVSQHKNGWEVMIWIYWNREIFPLFFCSTNWNTIETSQISTRNWNTKVRNAFILTSQKTWPLCETIKVYPRHETSASTNSNVKCSVNMPFPTFNLVNPSNHDNDGVSKIFISLFAVDGDYTLKMLRSPVAGRLNYDA